MDEEFIDMCHIHDCVLDGEGEVPVFYGFFGHGVEYGRAFQKLFRYSRSWKPGGCSVADGRPATATEKYCTACRAAEMKWLEDFIAQNPDETSFVWVVAKHYGLC